MTFFSFQGFSKYFDLAKQARNWPFAEVVKYSFTVSTVHAKLSDGPAAVALCTLFLESGLMKGICLLIIRNMFSSPGQVPPSQEQRKERKDDLFSKKRSCVYLNFNVTEYNLAFEYHNLTYCRYNLSEY